MKTTSDLHVPASTIEILETRIAPAAFFLHGNNLTITDGAGTVVTSDAPELAAASAAGATRALFMNAGDQHFSI